MPWGWLMFEEEKWAHSKYSIPDECMRMEAIANHLRQSAPGLRLHIVRYNSHAYRQNGVIVKPTQEERVAAIKETLQYIPDADFVITYICYRSSDGRPAITLDPNYTLQEYVRTAQKRSFSEPL